MSDEKPEYGVCPGGRTLKQRTTGQPVPSEDKMVCPGARTWEERRDAGRKAGGR